MTTPTEEGEPTGTADLTAARTPVGPAPAETDAAAVDLVRRARSGDAEAYQALVVRHRGTVYRLAYRTLSNRADAEDVTQEVFLVAWRTLRGLREDTAFNSWLMRIAVNRSLNAIRSRASVHDQEPDRYQADAPGGQPERMAEASAGLAALHQALRELPPALRVSWLLREQHGRSYEEIAHLTDTSVTTVRGRIARARARLAEVMSPWR